MAEKESADQRASRLLRQADEAREAWAEAQHEVVRRDENTARLKALRLDRDRAQAEATARQSAPARRARAPK